MSYLDSIYDAASNAVNYITSFGYAAKDSVHKKAIEAVASKTESVAKNIVHNILYRDKEHKIVDKNGVEHKDLHLEHTKSPLIKKFLNELGLGNMAQFLNVAPASIENKFGQEIENLISQDMLGNMIRYALYSGSFPVEAQQYKNLYTQVTTNVVKSLADFMTAESHVELPERVQKMINQYLEKVLIYVDSIIKKAIVDAISTTVGNSSVETVQAASYIAALTLGGYFAGALGVAVTGSPLALMKEWTDGTIKGLVQEGAKTKTANMVENLINQRDILPTHISDDTHGEEISIEVNDDLTESFMLISQDDYSIDALIQEQVAQAANKGQELGDKIEDGIAKVMGFASKKNEKNDSKSVDIDLEKQENLKSKTGEVISGAMLNSYMFFKSMMPSYTVNDAKKDFDSLNKKRENKLRA